MPSPQNPYSGLEIDPFAVAHKLNMPAAVFEAFKKAMCGGVRGHKDQRTDYTQAIDCLTRYSKDLDDGLVSHANVDGANEFIEEVTYCYRRFIQGNATIESMFFPTLQERAVSAAYLSGIEILKLFSPDYGATPAKTIIKIAIEGLQSAVFFLDKAEELQVQS